VNRYQAKTIGLSTVCLHTTINRADSALSKKMFEKYAVNII
jgi:hypothetical protein